MVKGEEPGKKDEEEVTSGRSYGSWHFFTIIVVLAVAVIGGYLCVHNRKKVNNVDREIFARKNFRLKIFRIVFFLLLWQVRKCRMFVLSDVENFLLF